MQKLFGIFALHHEDIQELSDKHLCSRCIGEAYLRELIEGEKSEFTDQSVSEIWE